MGNQMERTPSQSAAEGLGQVRWWLVERPPHICMQINQEE